MMTSEQCTEYVYIPRMCNHPLMSAGYRDVTVERKEKKTLKEPGKKKHPDFLFFFF